MHEKITAALKLPGIFPGLDGLTSDTMYLMGCRNFSQFCCTARGLEDPGRFCPFCEAERGRRKRVLEQITGGWGLLANEFPHKATSQMWLIVPRRHVKLPNEMTMQDWAEVGALLAHCQVWHVPSGGLLMRYGDPKYHVGTIEHLHFNVIEPKPGIEYRPPLAKNLKEHAEDYERLLDFKEELDSKGGPDWLFTDQGIAETQPAVPA